MASSFVPADLAEDLKQATVEACEKAEEGFWNNAHEEDALSGALGERLRDVTLTDSHGNRWRLVSKKFQSKGGEKVQETEWGADAIIQCEVEDKEGKMSAKSLLVQAKNGHKDWTRLPTQVRSMENLAKNGSAVVIYGESGYRAMTGQSYLDAPRGKGIRHPKGTGLGDFLAQEFLGCRIGLRDMKYDHKAKTLWVPDKEGTLRPHSMQAQAFFLISLTRIEAAP